MAITGQRHHLRAQTPSDEQQINDTHLIGAILRIAGKFSASLRPALSEAGEKIMPRLALARTFLPTAADPSNPIPICRTLDAEASNAKIAPVLVSWGDIACCSI
jgi:hypothetical protein